MNKKQTVSREEYRSLDNRVTCILQQHWPAKEISQWVGLLKGKQQAVACAILWTDLPQWSSTRAARSAAPSSAAPSWIAPGCITDRASPETAEKLNPMYRTR